MIDVHCHLEQKDYDADRENVIEECRRDLRAVITCSTRLRNFDSTIETHKKYPNFIFCALGLHPGFVKNITKEEVNDAAIYFEKNKKDIVAIGEIGLDYWWIKDEALREKQRELFKMLIRVAKKLELPVIVHVREAFEDAISILEKEKHKKVLMHLFGDKKFLTRVIDNGWSISIGPNILRSKTSRKITRDAPIERIMLETDSPWFGFGKRNTPLSVKAVAEKIAEIKKISAEDVKKQTDLNAVKFFNLVLE